jgi:signal transduction histidine kinase
MLGQQRDMAGLIDAANHAARGLFGQEPGYFFLDTERGSLNGIDGTELDALALGLATSTSRIAEALRAERPLELLVDETGPVVDRQVLRRLEADRATAVPMIDADVPVGVLVFRLSDEDPDTMAAFATELAGWIIGRRWDDRRRTTLFEQYRARHEKRLREIVHEANNPLSIINNYLHILELRLEGMPEAQEQLRMIGGEIRRTSEIVRTVVEFPAFDDSPTGAPLEAKRFDVNDVARKVIELLGGRAVATGIEVTQHLVPGVTVISDEDRVTQVMTNLARNAIEALHEGGVLEIETVPGVYRAGRAGVEFVVRDNGPGLPPDVLERLYEPKTSTKGSDHAGLGLHITGRLVGDLEGAIDVRTDPDRGTAFSVFLPDLT